VQIDSDRFPGAEPSRNPLKWRRSQVVPRVVTTGSLTSHVHFLAGPQGSPGLVFVLLHGIGMSHRYYRKLQALLAEHGDTLAIDLPGFGGTPTPDRQLSVADYAVHTAAVLQKMVAGPAVLVGHSMGTQFATELAVQRPDLVSHVALLGPVVDRNAVPSASKPSRWVWIHCAKAPWGTPSSSPTTPVPGCAGTSPNFPS
jgi:pimeloyl-ACP methyl ester carboxylesterase